MMNLKFVKTMNDNADPQTGQAWQTLWVSGGDFYLASSRQWNTPWELLDETMVFPSNEHGVWDSRDLAVDYPAKWTMKDHEKIANAGQKNRVEKNAETFEDEL